MSDQSWKCGNEFLPYHLSASHVNPDHRDGWNACFAEARSHIEGLQERCDFMLAATRDAQGFAILYGDQVVELRARIEADEALMRQAVEALLDTCRDWPGAHQECYDAITALRKRLESSK